MRDTVGWRMRQALEAQADSQFARDMADVEGSNDEAERWFAQAARLDGVALGHAFRALELARYGA